jgi:hypothetical protein
MPERRRAQRPYLELKEHVMRRRKMILRKETMRVLEPDSWKQGAVNSRIPDTADYILSGFQRPTESCLACA